MFRVMVIPLALIVLVAGAMTWSRQSVSTPADFTFINRGEVGTLDPNRMSWQQDIRIGYALWEGLYSLDPITLDPIPGTADKIDISPDKTVYTFHIRPSAKWSNGDPVTAGDFVFAWKRMLQEPGDYTYLFHYIKGAQQFEEAYAKDPKTANFDDVAIKAIERNTLRVELLHPVAFFPDICAFPCTFPLHERSMEKFREEDSTTGRLTYRKQFTLPPDLITNGPFMLTKWKFHERLRMEANPHYWDLANVKSKTIEQVSSSEPLWSFTMYDTGGVDWMAEVVGEIASELRKKNRSDLHVFPSFGTYFYSFNCRRKLNDGRPNPFADVRVRQAFSMAIDKNVIVENITRMSEPVSTTYIPKGAFSGYQSPPGLPMDIKKAQQLLADAGYPGGKGFPKIGLLFNNEGQHGPIAQNVRRQWADNLGVEVELEGVEIKQFRERLHNKDYTIARASWFGDYNDPSTFTDKYKPDSGNNDSDWKNVQYAELCAKADIEPDPAKRVKYFERAENLLLEEAPILPIYTYVNAYLYRDNVVGMTNHIRATTLFKYVGKSK